MQKNVASQKLIVYAYDATTNTPKTGDAANLTAYVSKDYGAVTVLADTSATEMDSTNAKGYYLFDLAQAETNADTLLFSAKSSTANIYVVGSPPTVFTTPANFSATAITAGGIVQADLQTIKTQSVTCAGGVTVPAATIASTTNITAGTITTVTNLTNAPGAGDFTAVMKTSIGTAVAASAVASVTGNIGGNVAGTVAGVTPATTAGILSAALTESYATDGSAATLTQLLYMVWSLLAERNVSGTTLTAKKLDGSTTSMTFTLNSATQPTGQTRAT